MSHSDINLSVVFTIRQHATNRREGSVSGDVSFDGQQRLPATIDQSADAATRIPNEGGQRMNRNLFKQVARVEFSKFIPLENRETPRTESQDPALLLAFQALAEEPEAPWLDDNFSSPRYFIYLYDSQGVILAEGELRRRQVFLDTFLFYTPRSEIWDLLEKIGGQAVAEPTATPPAN